MEIDQASEWRRLTEHYREMYDEELLNLAAESGDLTEIAQQVLRDEMKTRGLSNEPTAKTAVASRSNPELAPQSTLEPAMAREADDDVDGEADNSPEYTWKTVLCECSEPEQASQIFELLRRSQIESWIEAPSRYSTELGGPRVLVAADQLDQARELISQPIPQDIIDDSRMKLPEYKLPTCPDCGASDPILEAIEPVNSWSCDVCGKSWSEPAEA
jgi:hypothetical protein